MGRKAALILVEGLSLYSLAQANPIRLDSSAHSHKIMAIDATEANSVAQHAAFCVSPHNTADFSVVRTTRSAENLGCANPKYVLVAKATWVDSVEAIGWGQLHVVSEHGEKINSRDKGFAMGYLEGLLTASRISQQVLNYHKNMFGASADAQSGKFNLPPPKTSKFLADQLAWARDTAGSHVNAPEDERKKKDKKEKEYWETVAATVGQFDGVVAAYADATGIPLTLAEQHVNNINSNNDISDLLEVYNETAKPKNVNDNMYFRPRRRRDDESEEAIIEELTKLECSALVRVLDANADIVTAHTTWRPFFGMLRIFKYYTFALPFKTSTLAFSAAPGTLSSHDDFYITSDGLSIIETTNSVFDHDYTHRYAKTQSLLLWQRAVIASILATTGPEWIDYASQHNSGMYCNQWMIVDYKLFVPHDPTLAPFLLTVGEQLPDKFVWADGTPRLRRQGYWPSYNVPYFPEVFNASGYPDMVRLHGNDFTYENCSRAMIFDREAPTTHTVQDVQNLLRFNQWQTDPFSHGLAHESISARYDLSPKGSAFGGVDTKVTTWALARSMSAVAISGPTSVDQPVFAWSRSNYTESVSHVGLPDEYDFPWVRFYPKSLV
eukprot:comp22904_c0_seq1/m.36227 comp22904_c0_seq1/g.36227  ORF comp22904_c0_seq1/g.36227 comp22904_c0_seq1/m.36227 type:complete len:609 (-) comp22904_c0_seq1:44-1870(-)